MSEEESPGGPPNNIKVRPISSRSITVTWDPPQREQQNGVIRGYYIGYKMFGTSSQYVYKTLQIRDGNREEVILNGLKQNTQYTIVVQAFNTKGAGPSSEEVKIQTLEMDAPTSPQIQVTSSSGSSIHLAWDPVVVDDDNPIDGYIIFQREDSSTEWKEIRIVGQQSFYTAIDLKCGTRYQFYLVAYNRIGRGEPSDIVTVKTDGTVPVAPDKLSVVTANRSSALIHLDSWHHGGCPINKFKIRYRLLANNGEWVEIDHNLNDRLIELNGLIVSTRYQLQITAYNEVGFTEAEYTFATHSDSSHELNPRTASGHTIRGASNKHSTNTINEYSLVIPVAITLLVIVILLAIVVLVLRKSSNNGSIYSRKQDSLQMSHMDSCKSGRSTYTNSPYNTPHNCSNGTETAPKLNGEFANRITDEPLYATVKRTPRAPRNEAHIYSYPIQSALSEITNMQRSTCANGVNCTPNCTNSSQSIPQTATLIVTVDDRDLEEKLLDELQQQCPLNEHRLSMAHCR